MKSVWLVWLVAAFVSGCSQNHDENNPYVIEESPTEENTVPQETFPPSGSP